MATGEDGEFKGETFRNHTSLKSRKNGAISARSLSILSNATTVKSALLLQPIPSISVSFTGKPAMPLSPPMSNNNPFKLPGDGGK